MTSKGAAHTAHVCCHTVSVWVIRNLQLGACHVPPRAGVPSDGCGRGSAPKPTGEAVAGWSWTEGLGSWAVDQRPPSVPGHTGLCSAVTRFIKAGETDAGPPSLITDAP